MFVKDKMMNEVAGVFVPSETAEAEESRASQMKNNPINRSKVPTAPKFVDHEELRGRWAYEKLFGRLQEISDNASKHVAELHRFKQMHYCARQLKMLIRQHKDRVTRLKKYTRFAETHQQLRDTIAADNLGLVYELYKKCHIQNVDGDELLSEGMLALTRSIDTFNPWRGFRFSTYACNSILRAFYRCGLKENRRRQIEPVNFETQLERSDWSETQRDEDTELYSQRLSRILADGTAELTAIERTVIQQRFPLDERAERKTLADIGRSMRLSKERVRQIQNSALLKLRQAIDLDPVLN